MSEIRRQLAAGTRPPAVERPHSAVRASRTLRDAPPDGVAGPKVERVT